VNEHLTRREALVAAFAVTALGGQALARPRAARAAAAANIGVILPVTKGRPGDPLAASNILKSARLWTDWVNGRGGVDGQRVALKVYDDRGDPNRAAKFAVHAITVDQCAVILAGWDSSVAAAEIAVAHSYRVPMFLAYAWDPGLTKANYPEVVRIGPNNAILASAFAPFMKLQEYRHVALITDDTAFGRGLGGTIQATATLAGIDMVSQEFKRDTHDLRPNLKQVLVRKPHALVIAAAPTTPGGTLGVTQARAAGFKGDIVLAWDYVDDAFWKATGKHGVGVIWPTFSAPTLHFTSAGQAFKHLFTKKYKHAPLYYQALTWDQLNAWKWAVDTVGSVAPADVIPTLPRIDMQGTVGHITLSNKPGTVHFNQWDGVTVYFDQATKKGATDSTAKVIASIKGESP
jgi:branched-chain amino acid transport system substrate-binding protein